MLENGGLREAMLQRFGPADQLKIEQALAKGDPAAIEALPVQYCGMPAAVLPCQWLGDRALAAADFAQAMAWYDDGLRWASSVQQPDLAARKRLVSAMLGTAQGQPPIQPVSLGGVKVPPEQFEGWVREQLSRRRIGAEVASTDVQSLYRRHRSAGSSGISFPAAASGWASARREHRPILCWEKKMLRKPALADRPLSICPGPH